MENVEDQIKRRRFAVTGSESGGAKLIVLHVWAHGQVELRRQVVCRRRWCEPGGNGLRELRELRLAGKPWHEAAVEEIGPSCPAHAPA